MTRHDGCEHEPEVVAWLQGELDASDAERTERHVGDCPDCRRFADDARRVLGQLAEAGAEPAARTGRADRAPGRSRVPEVLAGLAVAVALVLLWWPDPPPEPPPSPDPVDVAAAWLVESQDDEGSWRHSTRDPLGAQHVAAHALGLLALIDRHEHGRLPALTGQDGPVDAALLRAGIGSAAAWLVEAQDADGRIGLPLDGGYCDHPLATMALLRAAAVLGDETLRRAADRATLHLVETQRRDGGWEARPAHGPAYGIAAAALSLASRDEVPGAAEALARMGAAGTDRDERATLAAHRETLASLGRLPRAAGLLLTDR